MVKAQKLPGNYYSLLLASISLYIALRGLLIIFSLDLPSTLAKAGHWQFLTNLSLAISVVVFTLNIISQLTKNIQIFHLKNELHAIAFTLESIVAIVYWPFRIFFIHLILPEGASIPLLLDLSIHLLPVVSLGIDYYFFMPQWRIETSHAYPLCVLLGACYWFHLQLLMDETSLFPYPFLQVETKHRIIIFGIIVHVAFGNFYLQRKLHDLIIGKEIDDTYDKSK